ncbi:MAG: ATP-binding protein [Nitrososphaerales archaeon]
MPLFDLNPKESPKELFAREKELDELVRLVEARRWVAILGPRMVGKTSLVKVANVKLEKAGFKTIYVNLWGAQRTQGLLNALARGLNSSRGLSQKIKEGIGRIEGVSLGPGGVAISAPKKPMTTVWDLLTAIGREAGDYVVELDEIQELAVISGHLLKILANIFNTYSNIVFVFTGSMFGLMKTLLEPGPSSPLYGRSPAKIYLQPFKKEQAISFLRKGFQEYDIKVSENLIDEVVEKLDGVPGWLTLYGNDIAVRKLHHEDALNATISEGLKIVKDELEHYLEGRDRIGHISALKAAATAARWTEIKRAIEIGKGSTVNDATVYSILESLRAAMLIKEEKGVYRVDDPMMRNLLLTSKLT